MTRRSPKPAAVRSARQGFDKSNLDAARVILLDILKYGGEGALPVAWARLIEAKSEPMDSEAGRLFRQAA